MTGIVTVTASAAIDQTYVLPRLEVGQLNRAVSAHREVSGKGVNVARAAQLGGATVSGVLALGERDLPLMHDSGFGDILHAVTLPGHTRLNATIIDARGITTKVNEAAAPMTRVQWDALAELALREVERLGADWLVLCGTMPVLAESSHGEAGAPALVPFTELVEEAAARGVRVVADTSGDSFDLLAGHLGMVALVKPNTQELAGFVGRELLTTGDVIQAARELLVLGVETVYVSMGEDGALGVSASGVWWAHAAAPALVNTAGAGDASLAGFLVSALHAGPGGGRVLNVPRALATAAAWGALAVSQATTLLSAPDTAPSAVVHEAPDPARALRDPARSQATTRLTK